MEIHRAIRHGQKWRWPRTCIGALLIVAAGGALFVLFLFPPDRYPFYPQCQFHRLTGLACGLPTKPVVCPGPARDRGPQRPLGLAATHGEADVRGAHPRPVDLAGSWARPCFRRRKKSSVRAVRSSRPVRRTTRRRLPKQLSVAPDWATTPALAYTATGKAHGKGIAHRRVWSSIAAWQSSTLQRLETR